MIGQIEATVEKLRGEVDKRDVGGVHFSGYREIEDRGEFKVAEHVDTGILVRTFQVGKTDIKSADDVERITRLLEILAAVDNLNVGYLYEVTSESNGISLVMEYWPRTLAEYVAMVEPIEETVLRKLVAQLLSGIKELHAQGLSIGQLKLDSLIVDDEGRIKILDFRYATLAKEPAAKRWLDCELIYQLPEQLRGEERKPFQADLWHVGVLIYTLIKRSHPFEGLEEESDLKEKITKAEIVLPGFASPSLKQLLRKLLSSEPSSRGSVEDILEHPWLLELEGGIEEEDVAEVNTAALLKMSSSFKMDKQFQKAMVDSLMTLRKNWLTAK